MLRLLASVVLQRDVHRAVQEFRIVPPRAGQDAVVRRLLGRHRFVGFPRFVRKIELQSLCFTVGEFFDEIAVPVRPLAQLPAAVLETADCDPTIASAGPALSGSSEQELDDGLSALVGGFAVRQRGTAGSDSATERHGRRAGERTHLQLRPRSRIGALLNGLLEFSQPSLMPVVETNAFPALDVGVLDVRQHERLILLEYVLNVFGTVHYDDGPGFLDLFFDSFLPLFGSFLPLLEILYWKVCGQADGSKQECSGNEPPRSNEHVSEVRPEAGEIFTPGVLQALFDIQAGHPFIIGYGGPDFIDDFP